MSEYIDSGDFIDDFLNKDRQAFNALFERYFEPLQIFANSIIRNEDESEDIVIKSFTKLYSKTEMFHPGQTTIGNIKAMMYIMVRNSCLDYLRSWEKRNLVLTPEASSDTLTHGTNIEHDIIKSEVLQALYAALNKLPKERKRALELLYYHGHSYQRAAEIMGVTIGTLKNYRRGGVAQMRVYINEDHLAPALLVLTLFLFS